MLPIPQGFPRNARRESYAFEYRDFTVLSSKPRLSQDMVPILDAQIATYEQALAEFGPELARRGLRIQKPSLSWPVPEEGSA